MANDQHDDYPGKSVDVRWDGRLCIHIGECGRSEGNLFVTGRDPWCRPDAVSTEETVDVIERCPSGALTYTRKDGGPAEAPAARNTALIANNGPIYLRGELEIDGAAADMSGVATRAALCRCGHSKNKPFCDNSHEEAGFVDRGAVGERGPGIDTAGGPLVIKRVANGPLLASGNLTVVAGGGREAWRGTKTAFCRCGHSKNKPFCDGSHKAAGFRAD